MEKRKLSSNMEDYLEAIAVLKKRNNVARVKDLSKLLSVKNSSVTSALRNLSKRGFVSHEKYGYVEFTKEGESLAQYVLKKHNVLSNFLTNILSIDPKIASEDACKMEHTLSQQTFQKLTKFMEFVKTCPDGQKTDWLKNFDYYFKNGKCRKCAIRKINQKLKGI